MKTHEVPCGACQACCKRQLIILEPEDDPFAYDCDVIRGPNGLLHSVKHKANGDCIYLGQMGCTIHGRAPAICRQFDCRDVAAGANRAKRKSLGMPDNDPVLLAGRARLNEARRIAPRASPQRPKETTL